MYQQLSLQGGQDVSPGLTAGGGLKHVAPREVEARDPVSPGLTAGGGLKPAHTALRPAALRFPRPHRRGRIETITASASGVTAIVSPGLTAGGGLKLADRAARSEDLAFPPASPPGAD